VVELSTGKEGPASKGYTPKCSCITFYLKYIYTEILVTKPRKRLVAHIQQSSKKKKQLSKQILEMDPRVKKSTPHACQ
jgi:hypothetical protein